MTALEAQRSLQFSAARKAFALALQRQPLGGAAFAVTVDGHEVLSLFGGEARHGEAWTADTRTTLMSVTKGLAGLVTAMLVDRGLLDVDQRIAEYWPEFAANGKQDITVRQVLTHTSGVIGVVPGTLGWDGRGWTDLDAVAAGLAAFTPAWTPGARRGYHAVTYGWLLGELVRRTDGRSMGQFFRDEIAAPLGVRTAIGVPPDQQGDISTVHPEGMDHPARFMRPVVRRARRLMRDPSTILGAASMGDGQASVFDNALGFLNSEWWYSAEVPASNGVSSARDLARVFAVLACGGALDGHRLITEKTFGLFTTAQPMLPDIFALDGFGPVLGRLMRRRASAPAALGYMANASTPRRMGPSPRAVGSGGYGGQFAYADPDRRVSLAFVRSALMWSEKELTALVKATFDDLRDV